TRSVPPPLPPAEAGALAGTDGAGSSGSARAATGGPAAAFATFAPRRGWERTSADATAGLGELEIGVCRAGGERWGRAGAARLAALCRWTAGGASTCRPAGRAALDGVDTFGAGLVAAGAG